MPKPGEARAPEAVAAFAARLRAAGFRGEVTDDFAARIAAATDNSIYELQPALVVFPRDAADLETLARVAAEEPFRTVRFAPRGGGTGTNGQSLSSGVVVDCSRHMNRILEIDPVGRRVRVEPGVVLDQLNAALAEHGLFFPPHTSTANRATIGGMVSTDACGKGSRRYGRTGDYVESVRMLLPDGLRLVLGRIPAAALASPTTAEERLGAQLRALVEPQRAAIRASFPPMHRSFTGYNLRDAFPESGDTDLARLVTGAEGTLGFISEIGLRVLPKPCHQALVVVRYRDFEAALRDAVNLLAANPSAIETLDQRIIQLAREDADWPYVQRALGDEEGTVVNLVEFRGDDREALEASTSAFVAALDARSDHAGYHRAVDANETARLWAVRAKSVGILGRLPGRRKPVPFIEDTVVPPEHLADYIRDFTGLLRRHGVDYAMFGHVDVGCLHVRPALDLADPADAALLRTLSDGVVALLRRYRGLLWGEHGKGMRGEYTREFVGDELYRVFAGIKRCFDPHNRMNPGKIVAPDGDPRAVLRIDGVPLRGARDRQVPADVRARWEKAYGCNGNGACFDWEHAQTLCPSYKATRDRVHSPKGRAMLLREWLHHAQTGDAQTETVARATYDAMMGCLGCRACATRCPTHVDIPALRSRFLDAYHRAHRRPARDYVLGALEHLLPALIAARGLINPLLESSLGKWACARLGLAALPRLPVLARAPDAVLPANMNDLLAACRCHPRPLVMVPDAFTCYLDPGVFEATLRVVRACGATPVVMPYRPSGKGLHVQGFLDRFRRLARSNAERFERVAELGVPLVAIDPAVTDALNADYAAVLGSRNYRIEPLAAWLARQKLTPRRAGGAGYRLALHCTERATQAGSDRHWRDVYAAAGLALEIVTAGCCGMAGSYGHLREHQGHSRALFDSSWRPLLSAGDPRPLLATGYSCRCQSGRFAGRRLQHPVEILAAHLA